MNSLAVQAAHRRLVEALKREGFIPSTDDDTLTKAPADVRGFIEVVGTRDKRLVYRRQAGDTLDLSALKPDEAVEQIRRTMLQPA